MVTLMLDLFTFPHLGFPPISNFSVALGTYIVTVFLKHLTVAVGAYEISLKLMLIFFWNGGGQQRTRRKK